MNYKLQETQVMDALKKRGLDNLFSVTNENGEGVLLQAKQELPHGECIISLDLEGTVCTPIYYFIGRLNNESKRYELLDELNNFNKNSFTLNFFLDKNSAIMSRITYIAGNGKFDADDYASLVENGYKSIYDNYFKNVEKFLLR